MPRGKRRGILGFSVPDVVAVRELMERQPPRRREICELLATGCSQREAAERLGMSPQRLHYHVRELRRAFVEAGFEGAPVRQKRPKGRTHWELIGLQQRRKKRRAAERRMRLPCQDLRQRAKKSAKKVLRAFLFLGRGPLLFK